MTEYKYNSTELALHRLSQTLQDYPQLDMSNVIVAKQDDWVRPKFIGIRCNSHGELPPFDSNRLSKFTGCKRCNAEQRTLKAKVDKTNKKTGPKLSEDYTNSQIKSLFSKATKAFKWFDKAVEHTNNKKSKPLYGVDKGSQEWIDYCSKDSSYYGKLGAPLGNQQYLITLTDTTSYVGLYRLELQDGSTILKIGFSNPLPTNAKHRKYVDKHVEVLVEYCLPSKQAVLVDLLSKGLSVDRITPISLSTVKSRKVRGRGNSYETYSDTEENVRYLLSILAGTKAIAEVIE